MIDGSTLREVSRSKALIPAAFVRPLSIVHNYMKALISVIMHNLNLYAGIKSQQATEGMLQKEAMDSKIDIHLSMKSL